MRFTRRTTAQRVLTGTILVLAGAVSGWGQEKEKEKALDQPAAVAPQVPPRADAADPLQAIHDDFNRQLLGLERQRLDRMARLAASQEPSKAAFTYEHLLRFAVASNLFQEAEAAAAAVIQKGSSSPTTAALAHLVKIIAEADRGAYEQSLESLKQAFETARKAAEAGRPRAALHADEIIGICDAYYQRLVHSGQYKIARQAFQLALEHAKNPAVREFLAGRLKRIDMVGKPAPAIEGTDIDGKPFRLADLKGKVVLVEFWASWCLPSEEEVEWFQHAAATFHGKGLEVVGVNLDTLQDGGQKLETVLPNIRRFLIDHNMSWPILVNGSGAQDYAGAYGVTDIPASVLIGRDGTIVELDLVRKNLEEALARELSR